MGYSRKKVRIRAEEEEDRISGLPDELIHHIFSFIDTTFAVQTSILSNRWKRIWKTLPYINLDENYFPYSRYSFFKLVNHIFSRRNHQSDIFRLNLICHCEIKKEFFIEIIQYAISHDVQDLTLDRWDSKFQRFPLCNFSSPSLKELRLVIPLNLRESPETTWCLPALTTLHLRSCNLPESCFSLPSLTTLKLVRCNLPQSSWNLPVLRTLYLSSVVLPKRTDKLLSELVNLQNLILLFCLTTVRVCNILAPQLMYLTISSYRSYKSVKSYKLVVSAPKLYEFSSFGLNPVVLSAANCVERVRVEISEIRMSNYNHDLKLVALPLTNMFEGLQNAKILTLTCGTIKILSMVSELLKHHRSPFLNLEYVLILKKCKDPTIPSNVREYLLGESPSATIIMESQKLNESPQMTPVMMAQHVGLEDPSATHADDFPVVGDVITTDGVARAEAAATGHELDDHDCMILPSMQAHSRDKGPIAQPENDKPLVVHNVEDEGGYTETIGNVLHFNDRKASSDSVVEAMEVNLDDERIQQKGENPVLVENDDQGDEIEGQVKVHADKELIESRDENIIVEDVHGGGENEEEHVVEDAGVDSGRLKHNIRAEEVTKRIQAQGNVANNFRVQGARGLVPRTPVAGAGNNHASSSRADDDFGLWQGHEVYLEFVDLLELIHKNYPETFEHFVPQSKMFNTVGLNMLCTSVNAFSEVSMAEVTATIITHYRVQFTDLQRWGFCVTWLVNRLNCVEQLLFSQPLVGELRVIDNRIADAQRELHDLQALRVAKMAEIQEAFGDLGTSLAAGNLGDGLFTGH